MNKKDIAISFYLTRSLFLGGTISILLKNSSNILISSIIGTMLGTIILYFIKNYSIPTIIKIIISIIIIFINILSNLTLTNTFLLEKTPLIILLTIYLLTILYTTKKDTDTPKYISTLLLPVSIIFILSAYFGLFKLTHLYNLLPLKLNLNMIRDTLFFTSSSLLPILLIDKKNKSTITGYVLGCLVIISIFYFTISIYGQPFSKILRYPEFLILKKINLKYLTNVENIYILEWLFTILISSSLSIITIKNNTNKNNFFIILFLIISTILLVIQKYEYILFIKNNLYLLIISITIISLSTLKKV